MSKFKQVRIVWDDAESSDGWDGIPDKLDPKLVTTIGFLLLETEKHVLLAASVGHGDEDCNNRLQIPKAMIQTMEVIDGGSKAVAPVAKGTHQRGKNASRYRPARSRKS